MTDIAAAPRGAFTVFPPCKGGKPYQITVTGQSAEQNRDGYPGLICDARHGGRRRATDPEVKQVWDQFNSRRR